MGQFVGDGEGTVDHSVSVIVPVRLATGSRRRRETLGEALLSIVSQTVIPQEIIIVVSGELDESAFRSLVPSEIELKIIREEAPSGPSKARNTGIHHARSEVIAFLDSDDIWKEEYLELMLELFQDDSVNAAYAMAFSTKNGRMFARTYEPVASDQLLQMIKRNFIQALSAFMARRDTLLEINGFDESISQPEDLDLYIRLLRTCEIKPLPYFLVERRVGEDSMTEDYRHRYIEILRTHKAIAAKIGSLIDRNVVMYLASLRMLRVVAKLAPSTMAYWGSLVSLMRIYVWPANLGSAVLGMMKLCLGRSKSAPLKDSSAPIQVEAGDVVLFISMSAFDHSRIMADSFLVEIRRALGALDRRLVGIPVETTRLNDDRIPLSLIFAGLGQEHTIIQTRCTPQEMEEIIRRAGLVVSNHREIITHATKQQTKGVFLDRLSGRVELNPPASGLLPTEGRPDSIHDFLTCVRECYSISHSNPLCKTEC